MRALGGRIQTGSSASVFHLTAQSQSIAGAGTLFTHRRGVGLLGQKRTLAVDAGYENATSSSAARAANVVRKTIITSDLGLPVFLHLETLIMRGGAQLEVSGTETTLLLETNLTGNGNAVPSLTISNGTQLLLPAAFEMKQLQLQIRNGVVNHSGTTGTMVIGAAGELQLHNNGRTAGTQSTGADGSYVWAGLHIHKGGVVTVHSLVSSNGSGLVSIRAAEVVVSSGGRIHAEGLGHAGRPAGVRSVGPAAGPSAGSRATGASAYGEHGAAGGAHAGLGGDARLAGQHAPLGVPTQNGSGNISQWESARLREPWGHGSALAPVMPGGGGGASYHGGGGAGGGRVRLDISGTFTLNGVLSAN